MRGGYEAAEEKRGGRRQTRREKTNEEIRGANRGEGYLVMPLSGGIVLFELAVGVEKPDPSDRAVTCAEHTT